MSELHELSNKLVDVSNQLLSIDAVIANELTDLRKVISTQESVIDNRNQVIADLMAENKKLRDKTSDE